MNNFPRLWTGNKLLLFVISHLLVSFWKPFLQCTLFLSIRIFWLYRKFFLDGVYNWNIGGSLHSSDFHFVISLNYLIISYLMAPAVHIWYFFGFFTANNCFKVFFVLYRTILRVFAVIPNAQVMLLPKFRINSWKCPSVHMECCRSNPCWLCERRTTYLPCLLPHF